MALYQQTVKSSYNTNTNAAMESWISNFVAFINNSTGIGASYTLSSQTANRTSFVLNLPVSGSEINRFGMIMSTDSGTTEYLSCAIYNSATYGYGTAGNCFDYTNYYAKRVLILKNDDTFYILVEKSVSEFTTIVALNKVTEVGTGTEYWASRGLVPTSATAYTLQNLTVARSGGAVSGAVSNDVSLANAFTADNRYMMNNMYAYHAPSVAELPKFMRFAVEDDGGDIHYAILLGSTTIKSGTTLYGAGEFLFFID